MVHYGQDCFPVQPLPPTCPKCGSHRTQVVGRSNDSRTVIIRCSACGERSSVVVGEDSTSSGHAPVVGAADSETGTEDLFR